jgi:hypothetical protein
MALAARSKLMFLERASSTLSTMCFGIFLSAVNIRPNLFGKTTTSPRICGTPAAGLSGLSIAIRMQGMSLHGCGRNGSVKESRREHLLRLVLGREWTWTMKLSLWNQKTKSDSISFRASRRPDAASRACQGYAAAATDGPAPARSRFAKPARQAACCCGGRLAHDVAAKYNTWRWKSILLFPDFCLISL